MSRELVPAANNYALRLRNGIQTLLRLYGNNVLSFTGPYAGLGIAGGYK